MLLTPADLTDSTDALAVVDALKSRWPWVKHLFAAGAYDRRTLLDKVGFLNFMVGGAPDRETAGVHPVATTMGHETNIRLDDALAPTGARL